MAKKEIKCPDCGTLNPKFAVKCELCQRVLQGASVGTAIEGKNGGEMSSEEETTELPPQVVDMQFSLVCPNCNQKSLTYDEVERFFKCPCGAKFALARVQ